jgi:hypothetical protein
VKNSQFAQKLKSMGNGWKWLRICLISGFGMRGGELLSSATTVLEQQKNHLPHKCTQPKETVVA